MKIVLILLLCTASVCQAQHYVAYKQDKLDLDYNNTHVPAAAGTVIGVAEPPLPHQQWQLRVMTTDHQIISNLYGKMRVVEGGLYGEGEFTFTSVNFTVGQQTPISDGVHSTLDVHLDATCESSTSLTECYAVIQYFEHGQPTSAQAQALGDVKANEPQTLSFGGAMLDMDPSVTYKVYFFSGYKEIKAVVSTTHW